MKKYFLIALFSFFSSTLYAGEWDYSAKGLVGAYYGVSETKAENKYPNRIIGRGNATINAGYVFDDGHKLGVEAAATIIVKEDDKDRSEGEYRFYPYVKDEHTYNFLNQKTSLVLENIDELE